MQWCRSVVKSEGVMVTHSGVYPPNGNDANSVPLPSPSFPFPSPPSPLPLHALSLHFPPLPGGLGQSPQWRGFGGYPRKKIEIEIGFGACWRIFVSKRQLNINIQIRAKRKTYKLRMTHICVGILPPSGCNSLPPEPNLDASCVHFLPL